MPSPGLEYSRRPIQTWWPQVVDALDAYHRANPLTMPGAAAAVETLDGRMVTHVGAGWNDRTICDIGTVTKAFTATALLLALEESTGLDVETHVWSLAGMDAYAADERTRAIRVRHLLQHTSHLAGILPCEDAPATPCNDPAGAPPRCDDDGDLGPVAPFIGFPGGTNERMLAHGRCRPARHLTMSEVGEYVMRAYRPLDQPGSSYAYSPLNYVVAGHIVEVLTGRSLNIYLKEKIFKPLKMHDSFFIAQSTGDPRLDGWMAEGVTEEQRERIADVTLITRDGLMPPEVAPGPDGRWDKFRRHWRFVYPDGGMYTTVADLLTFLAMLRDGGVSQSRRILSPAIVQLLVADQGFGHTMGFGYRAQATRLGQRAGTLEHLGAKMTYLWMDISGPAPVIGTFFSQRLPNVAVNTNIGDGIAVIFDTFLAAVMQGIRGPGSNAG